jgi:hypothetical protein
MRLNKHFIALAALVGAIAALSIGALAAVSPGTFTPNAGSFDPANAPGSSHLTSGSPSCTVNANRSIDCSAYVLGGVGHTNATVLLSANYSAIIDCRNPGNGNVVESHTSTFTASSSATVPSVRNGQLNVPTQSVSPFSAPQVCPNPNWTPEIRGGSVTLDSFTYTLTFAGFANAYITIDGIAGN